MNSDTNAIGRYRPGDHVRLTWLDSAGEPVDTNDFTITTHAAGDPSHELWIECPLLQHIGNSGPGDIVTFAHADSTVTVRIDCHKSEHRP